MNFEAYIRRHHTISIATVDKDGIWIATVWYAVMKRRNKTLCEQDKEPLWLIFHSSPETRHGAAMAADGRLAAEKRIAAELHSGRRVANLRGVQMTGTVRRDDSEQVRRAYLRRFPIARFAKLTLWVFEVDFVKVKRFKEMRPLIFKSLN